MGRSISYMGNCKRFSSAKQAAYYVGLVPGLIFQVTPLITAEL
ncbi:transposase, IS116/IS110/IS902 domain protein [Leptospira interrogans str. Brem 329]|nr:transposase, IS116/IS110/IS902 domain protein [Leptospira interrogans str. Brem 329]